MKILYPAQERAKDSLVAAIKTHGAALDASQTGLGKTVVAGHVIAELGRPVGVICPKIVLPAWDRELRDAGVEPLFVLNYEKIRNGSTEWLGKKNKKMYTWNLPPDTVLIFDECHKAKNPKSQTAALHLAATRQGIATLSLSATAAVAAPDMRALGFALGQHTDQARVLGRPSFETWLRKHGCFLDPWRNWKPGAKKHLLRIHEALFGGEVPRAVRLTVDDLPAAFKNNLVLSDPLDFGPEMRKAYDAVMDSFEIDWSDYKHLKEEQMASTELLLEMMKARQTSEALKIPHIIGMAEDLLDEGKSVAIFVNFTDSIDRIVAGLPCPAAVIRGGQTAAEREAEIQRFQSDEARVIVANIAAGGAGVSLHDVRGEFPRASLISPSFNLIDLVQTLGRIYRNGMKTPCVQHVLLAEGTIEESIGESLQKKTNRLDALLGGV